MITIAADKLIQQKQYIWALLKVEFAKHAERQKWTQVVDRKAVADIIENTHATLNVPGSLFPNHYLNYDFIIKPSPGFVLLAVATCRNLLFIILSSEVYDINEIVICSKKKLKAKKSRTLLRLSRSQFALLSAS